MMFSLIRSTGRWRSWRAKQYQLAQLESRGAENQRSHSYKRGRFPKHDSTQRTHPSVPCYEQTLPKSTKVLESGVR